MHAVSTRSRLQFSWPTRSGRRRRLSVSTARATNNQDANNTGTNGNTAPPAAPTAKVNVEVFYVHPDHLGTPRVITASTALNATTGTGITSPQTVNKAVWRWDSDPFGSNATANSAPNENPNTLSQVVGTATLPYLFGFDLAFPGQKRDRETGKHYNYFRDYDPGVGRYVESDPIGLRASLLTFGYVSQSPLRHSDPSGLINWTGTVKSYGAGPYSQDDYTLESECKCGRKAKVRVQALGFAVGKGITKSWSNATFEDSFSCPEPWVFDGPYFKVGAGISGGYGTNFSFILMGGARSPGSWGPQVGLDLSAGVVVGKATVQEPIEWTFDCDCKKN